jgi:hypothetical protein
MNTHSCFLTLILTIFLALSQVVIANTVSEEILEKIISNESYCVQKYDYDHDRIYLSSENLYPTSNGIFLDLNGNEYIHLPLLQSDNSGCWIRAEKIKILNDCPFCGRPYFIKCKNPSCPSNKKGR